MALPKIGWNEGSLLRRTLLHVGTFLVGSAAFIGLVSFVLVTIAKGLVAPRTASADDEPEVTASATPKTTKAAPSKARVKRGAGAAAAAAAATAKPAANEE